MQVVLHTAIIKYHHHLLVCAGAPAFKVDWSRFQVLGGAKLFDLILAQLQKHIVHNTITIKYQ